MGGRRGDRDGGRSSTESLALSRAPEPNMGLPNSVPANSRHRNIVARGVLPRVREQMFPSSKKNLAAALAPWDTMAAILVLLFHTAPEWFRVRKLCRCSFWHSDVSHLNSHQNYGSMEGTIWKLAIFLLWICGIPAHSSKRVVKDQA